MVQEENAFFDCIFPLVLIYALSQRIVNNVILFIANNEQRIYRKFE